MSDQTPEAFTPTEPHDGGGILKPLNEMTLEQILSSARRVEKTAHICRSAHLQAEFDDIINELASLVDEDGKVRSDGDESSLADEDRAQELNERAEAVHAQMQQAMFHVRFRAMSSDDWEVFEKRHRPGGPGTAVKDAKKWVDEMIVACAIEPTITAAQMEQMRQTFGHQQIEDLGNHAFWANTTGGLDVPKLPSFSRLMQPQE